MFNMLACLCDQYNNNNKKKKLYSYLEKAQHITVMTTNQSIHITKHNNV